MCENVIYLVENKKVIIFYLISTKVIIKYYQETSTSSFIVTDY